LNLKFVVNDLVTETRNVRTDPIIIIPLVASPYTYSSC